MSNLQKNFSPTSIDDFVFSDPTSEQTLRGILDGSLPFPLMKRALCLWGTYGTGKTTLAEMLPSLLEQSGSMLPSSRQGSLFGGNYYVDITPCGSGSNAVSLMQDIRKRVSSDLSHSSSGWHYEILDEVDLLTPIAQASLKSLITQSSSTIFILTTNHLSKLDRGLIDRSLLIEMNQPRPERMELIGRRLLRRMGLDGDEVESEVMHTLATSSRGSLRDFGTAVISVGLRHGGKI